MIWALIITGLLFGETGKLTSTQGVMAFASEADCQTALVVVRDEMLKNNPAARVVIGCVPLQKPVRS